MRTRVFGSLSMNEAIDSYAFNTVGPVVRCFTLPCMGTSGARPHCVGFMYGRREIHIPIKQPQKLGNEKMGRSLARCARQLLISRPTFENLRIGHALKVQRRDEIIYCQECNIRAWCGGKKRSKIYKGISKAVGSNRMGRDLAEYK